jgi:hypothetical protein
MLVGLYLYKNEIVAKKRIQMNRLFKVPRFSLLSRPFLNTRFYSHALDPANKTDYSAYVAEWRQHFTECEDDFELGNIYN